MNPRVKFPPLRPEIRIAAFTYRRPLRCCIADAIRPPLATIFRVPTRSFRPLPAHLIRLACARATCFWRWAGRQVGQRSAEPDIDLNVAPQSLQTRWRSCSMDSRGFRGDMRQNLTIRAWAFVSSACRLRNHERGHTGLVDILAGGIEILGNSAQ